MSEDGKPSRPTMTDSATEALRVYDPTMGPDGKRYPLTLKQEAFVRAYRQSGNATEAYKQVYGCVGWASNAINVAGSKMLAKPKIAARVAELGEEAAGKIAVTVEWFVDRLIRRADKADADGDNQAATQAEALATKLLGMQVDKVDQTVRQATPADHKPDMYSLRRSAAPPPSADADQGAAKTIN